VGGRKRKDVSSGLRVAIVLKEDQRTGRLTRGVQVTSTYVEICLSGFFIAAALARRGAKSGGAALVLTASTAQTGVRPASYRTRFDTYAFTSSSFSGSLWVRCK
jgi:hypothetical protein